MKPVHAAVLASVVLLAACAGEVGQYSQPYGLFAAEGRRPVEDERLAIVTAIDGHSVDIRRQDPVPVGTHIVELSIPGAPGMLEAGEEKVQIEVKPCVRYYFAAKRSSPTARDWHVVVAGVEPIGECVKKYGGGTI
jgi:hypothetical protein